MTNLLVLHVRRKNPAEHLLASGVTYIGKKSKSALIVLSEWHRRSRSRRRRTCFNERLLADIGIDRSEAEAEAAKWFWQR